MKITVKTTLAVLAALALTACNQNKFHVEGEITNAKDSVLYFENVGLTGIEVLDSAKLGTDGRFAFSHAATDAPEFYRLRIGDQIVNIAIDSTETVTVTGDAPALATRYDVKGSENCQKIKELALKQIAFQELAIALERNTDLSRAQFSDSLFTLLQAYKEDVKQNYIFKEPNKSYAYFALFQTIGPWLIFDPKSNPDDVKVFAAVATCWDTYYPGAQRGENLHNIAIEGMKNVRILDQKNGLSGLEPSKVVETGIIDIELPDNKGVSRRLSSLKGQVVLLDFHVFAMNESPQRILMLRELYNKYHAQGLEIYQVSLDSDEHFWKQQTAALPWISVRDADGIQSEILVNYNVTELPEYFLIDRQNNLVKRSGQMKDLETETKALL
jgi:peroxiredoxin